MSNRIGRIDSCLVHSSWHGLAQGPAQGRSTSCLLLVLCVVLWQSTDMRPLRACSEDIIVQPVFINLIEQSQVPALEEGPVAKILIQEGQMVEEGAILIQIDDQRASFAKQQADYEWKVAVKKAADRSAIDLAQTEFKVANASLQRALESRRRFPDSPSQAEVDEIELKVAQAKQHLDKAHQELQLAEFAKDFAEHQLSYATFGLDRHKIRSPLRGTVVEILAKKGDWLRPGDTVARVIRTDRLRVEGNVPREKIQGVVAGCKVTVMIDGSEQQKGKYTGKVTFVSPEVDPNDGRQRVLAEIENPRGTIGPGMRASMVVHRP